MRYSLNYLIYISYILIPKNILAARPIKKEIKETLKLMLAISKNLFLMGSDRIIAIYALKIKIKVITIPIIEISAKTKRLFGNKR